MSQDKTIAKYLNSPESEIYHKSRVLYGISQAKRAIIQQDKCYLVEGYTDVTSLHQSGIENVVASSGTSLTQDQIRLIRRFTNNVTIIYDGDQAGIKASMRGIDMVLEEGINVKVLPLPEGEDPDSFSRSMGASQLVEYIKENETDFIKFKTRLLLLGTDNDPISRARLISDIVKSISVIPEEIVRTEYLKECSRLLDVRETVLYNEIRKLKSKSDEEATKQHEREIQVEARTKNLAPPLVTGGINPCENEERELLKLLLKFGTHVMVEVENPETGGVDPIYVANYILSELENDGMVSVDEVIRTVFNEYALHWIEENFDPVKYFVNHPQQAISHLVSDILSEKNKLSDFWRKRGNYIKEDNEVLPQLVPKVVGEYKLRYIRSLISQTDSELKKAAQENDFEAIQAIQTKIQRLKSVEKLICDPVKRTITY